MVSKTTNIENVIVKFAKTNNLRATLSISNYAIILTLQELKIPSIIVLIKLIDRCDKIFDLNSNILILYLKTINVIQLEFNNLDVLLEISAAIESQKNYLDVNEIYYAEIYRSNFSNSNYQDFGWNIISFEKEYEQLLHGFEDQWIISSINKNFQISPSYPPLLLVPKAVSEQLIDKCANFRKNKRFPVLSYIYPESGGYILRCSQPLVGPRNNRCKADEDYLTTCLRTGKRGYIVDTRSSVNIQLAKNLGGGTEHESRYPQWKRIYIPLDTLTFQESYRKLVAACLDACVLDKWLSTLDACNWLSHVHCLLGGARLLADTLRRTGSPILIHGGNDCDSSAQLSSLIQILLNPKCRTYSGFQSLIQREWVWMGHPFRDRCGGAGPFSESTSLLLNMLLQQKRALECRNDNETFQTFVTANTPAVPQTNSPSSTAEECLPGNLSTLSLDDVLLPKDHDSGVQFNMAAISTAPNFTRKKASLRSYNGMPPPPCTPLATLSSNNPGGNQSSKQNLLNRAKSFLNSGNNNVRRLNNTFKSMTTSAIQDFADLESEGANLPSETSVSVPDNTAMDNNGAVGLGTTVNRQGACPTFVIFLDCVLQMMRQFPTRFQFNAAFVRELFKHAYASQFGTFLYNSCHEREVHEVRAKTVCLWYYLNLPEMKESFTNKFFDESSLTDPHKAYLELDTNPQNLELSPELFSLWNIYNPYQSADPPAKDLNCPNVQNETSALESLYQQLIGEEHSVVAKIKLLQKCF